MAAAPFQSGDLGEAPPRIYRAATPPMTGDPGNPRAPDHVRRISVSPGGSSPQKLTARGEEQGRGNPAPAAPTIVDRASSPVNFGEARETQNSTVPLQPPPGFAPIGQSVTGERWRLPTAGITEPRVERPFPGIGPGLYSPETLIGRGRTLPTFGQNDGQQTPASQRASRGSGAPRTVTAQCQTDSAQPPRANARVQVERLIRPDFFGLPPELNLYTCIQATRLPGESVDFLLQRISRAYRENLDRPLSETELENLRSILNLVAGVRRAQCQELLEAASILEGYRIQGRRNHRLARNITDTAQITADWQLDEEMFLETRPLLVERLESADEGEDWSVFDGPM